MKQPVGINGEHLDILISSFNEEELAQLKKYNYLIGWLEDFFLDPKDVRKLDGMKMGKSTSLLYFQDKFMAENHNVFSAENANEGILHVLFYLSVLISRRTPQFFGIDNIETALNPHLCRHLMKGISELAIENEKQIVVTTHNPAILDGLDLTNDDIRLFEVYRGDKGDTRTRRIQFKKGAEKKYKLSEMWMKGMLGAISQNF
jgi:predicted ATPase